MIGIIAHWDHKLNASQEWLRHSYQMFDYAARAYNVDELVFVDLTGTLSLLQPPETKIVTNLIDALNLFDTSHTLHYLCADGDTELFSYQHPENAVYVVGPDYNSSIPYGDKISVPMANQKMELWASQVVSIVLAHRFSQWQ